MPFEAKFLNLSTDNYQCFLVNPSNFELVDSIELDETAINKMICPFDKLIILMKNLTNTNEQLIFDLPQCELYTIDKDFSQLFTIIKNDKHRQRYEGQVAPKDLKFHLMNNNQNLNKLENINDKIPNNVGVESATKNSLIYDKNVDNYNKIDDNEKNTNYGNESREGCYLGFYSTNNQLSSNDYLNKYNTKNHQYQNISFPNNDKTTNLETSIYDYYPNQNIHNNNNLNFNFKNNQYIYENLSKDKDNLNTSPTPSFYLQNSNILIEDIKNQNTNKILKENNDSLKPDINPDNSIRDDIINNRNLSLKSTENNSSHTYTLDNFDLNKFLKELNLSSICPEIDNKEIKDLKSNTESNSNNQKIDELKIENFDLNSSIKKENKEHQSIHPIATNEIINTKDIGNKIPMEDKINYDSKLASEDQSFRNMSKSAVINIGSGFQINNNDEYHNIFRNKNDIEMETKKTEYENFTEKSNLSKSIVYEINPLNKFSTDEEIKRVNNNEKKENTNLIISNYYVNPIENFDDNISNRELNNTCLKDENSIFKTNENINNEEGVKLEKNQQDVNFERNLNERLYLNISAPNATLNLSSTSNKPEEKKIPTTLIDFNIDDYLTNILKEYQPSFLNIPSPIPFEEDSKVLKINPDIHHIEEEPITPILITAAIKKKMKEESKIKVGDEQDKIIESKNEYLEVQVNDINESKSYKKDFDNKNCTSKDENKINAIQESMHESDIKKDDELNTQTVSLKKSFEISLNNEKQNNVYDSFVSYKNNENIEFPPIEIILGNSNLNFDEIFKKKDNKDDILNNNNKQEDNLDRPINESIFIENNKIENKNFNDISNINLQTDINIHTINFIDNTVNEDLNNQMNNSILNNIDGDNKDVEYKIEENEMNGDFINKDMSFNNIQEGIKENSNQLSCENNFQEISFREKSFEKSQENELTLNPNNKDIRNSFILEEIKATNSIKVENVDLQEKISLQNKNINLADDSRKNEFNNDYELYTKENLNINSDGIDKFYQFYKNFDKSNLDIILKNNFLDENKNIFNENKTENAINIKNNSSKTLYLRLTGKDEKIKQLSIDSNLSFLRKEGEINQLQISFEPQYIRGPIYNVFPGCNYSIDNKIQLYDSNDELINLSHCIYPENLLQISSCRVLFTFLDINNIFDYSFVNDLTNENFITFINATSESISIRIISDGENDNEDYHNIYPLMAIIVKRKKDIVLFTEVKTNSQKILKYNLSTNNIYILDEDHTLVKTADKQIIESLEQTNKFKLHKKNKYESVINTNNKINEISNEVINIQNQDQIYSEEDYFTFEETEFDEENLNEFNIENASSEHLYLRIEKKTEGSEEFFLLKSLEDKWVIREDGMFLCEIIRSNLSSKRFIVNSSYCYEIDSDFNLLEYVTKKPIKRCYDKLTGNNLIYEDFYAQINYDFDFECDLNFEYFLNVKPKYIKGEKFIDKSFPPKNYIVTALNPFDKKRCQAKNVHSFQNISKEVVSTISFKRPEVIFNNQKYYLFNYSSNGIETYHQSYVSSILTNLNQNHSLIKQIFKSAEINKDGYYEIFYFENGVKKIMFIDDYLPIIMNKISNEEFDNKAYFSEIGSDNEIWLNILEKAYAKYEGGYANTSNGDVLSEIYFFTGLISHKYQTKGLSETKIWENLLACSNNDYHNKNITNFIFAGFNDLETKTPDNEVISLTQFVYAVLDCDEFDNGVETIRLIKIKNPAGPIEWMGDYSKLSDKWSYEMKNYFEADSAYSQTGVFFLSFEEFVEQFDFYVVTFAS